MGLGARSWGGARKSVFQGQSFSSGDEKSLQVVYRWANVLHATELCSQKCPGWQGSCYI